MTNPLYTSEQLPTTSLAAIREFDDRYIAALGAAPADGWADRFGALVPTSAPLVTFPVSQLRSKFQRTQGEGRAKTLGEKSFDVKSEEFDDGYEARLIDIFQQVFAYRRWQQAPAALVNAEAQFRQAQIAALLEDGENRDFLDTGKKFFSATHFANLFDDGVGNFANYDAAGGDVVSVANIQTQVTAMNQVTDENGVILGVMPDIIGVHFAKYEPLKNLLKKELIANVAGTAAESNPYMNGFTVVPIKELTDQNDWYLIDSKLASTISPWIAMRQTVPSALALRVFDEASDFFKKTGRLRIEAHIWNGFSLGLPHAIRKVKVA